MKYIKPTYKNEVIETADIILVSTIGGEEGVAKIEATSSTSAKVSASVQSVLGSLYK